MHKIQGFAGVVCSGVSCIEETHAKFRALLDKTNKEHPSPKDVKALAELLSGNKKLELWRDIASAGYLAEILVIENARANR